MRAIVQEGYGGPEVVRVAEVPEPVPGARDVAIRVGAAGVHAGDVRIMRGEPLSSVRRDEHTASTPSSGKRGSVPNTSRPSGGEPPAGIEPSPQPGA